VGTPPSLLAGRKDESINGDYHRIKMRSVVRRRLEAGIEVAWAMLCTKAAHRMSVGRFRTFFTPSLLLTRKFYALITD
jgi:hypothetical protein